MDIETLGAANELLWRAARIITDASGGLWVGRRGRETSRPSRWMRESTVRTALATSLYDSGNVVTDVGGRDQQSWTRVGYVSHDGSTALLTVEVTARTRAERDRLMHVAAPLTYSGFEGHWVTPNRQDVSWPVVHATLDDHGVDVVEATDWMRQRLDELAMAGIAATRSVPGPSHDEAPATRAQRKGSSVFSWMRGADRDIGQHLQLVIGMAIDVTAAPLLRRKVALSPRAGYADLTQYVTSIEALGSIPQVDIAIPGEQTVVCVEGRPRPGERSWQELHDAITPEDGALWADIRLFLRQTGLAIPQVMNRVDQGGLSRAQAALKEVVRTLASVLDESTANAIWSARPPSGAQAVERRMLAYWARTSRLIAWRNASRHVFMNVGWFPRSGDLVLAVTLAVDPARRALRDTILDRGSMAGLEGRWLLGGPGWQSVSISTDPSRPDAAVWLTARVQELSTAGLLVPFDRSGKVSGEAFPPGWLPILPRGQLQPPT